MGRLSLSSRLLLSHLLVVAIASAAAFGTARWLGPQLFDHEIQQIGQRFGWSADGTPGAGSGPSDSTAGRGRGEGQGPGGQDNGSGATSTTGPSIGTAVQQQAIDDELSDAFTGSLTVAVLVAVGVGLLAGLVAAALISRGLLNPLRRLREAVRRMAAGDHAQQVEVPADPELADLAMDVNALGVALLQTEERRAALVSDLAHELRTPITSLDGFLEGLEDGVFEPDEETLSAMRTETRRLERLAADLGALSRTDENAFDLATRDMDLGAAAVSAARSLAGAFTKRGVRLDIATIEPLPVTADPDRMGQVFTNLLRNALQQTPREGSVSVSGERAGGSAVVRVTDSGAGIAAADLERIFDRFVRLAGSDPSGGAGIGLTIARGIVRAHGGDLTAESSGPGEGASFVVTIPVRR